MIKHVTEIQSIASPIFHDKFKKCLDGHIKLISEAIDRAALKGDVVVKIVLTEHTENYYIKDAITDIGNYDVLTSKIPKYMQMQLSNALADLFMANCYHYQCYDEDVNGFNVKHIHIYWCDGFK